MHICPIDRQRPASASGAGEQTATSITSMLAPENSNGSDRAWGARIAAGERILQQIHQGRNPNDGTVTPAPSQVRGGSGRLSLAADFMVQGDVGGVYGGMPMKYGPVVVPSLEYGR